PDTEPCRGNSNYTAYAVTPSRMINTVTRKWIGSIRFNSNTHRGANTEAACELRTLKSWLKIGTVSSLPMSPRPLLAEGLLSIFYPLCSYQCWDHQAELTRQTHKFHVTTLGVGDVSETFLD